jgi:hypothetical protein
MEIGISILPFLELADLDDAFGPFIQQTQNLVINAIDLFPVVGKVSGHSQPPLPSPVRRSHPSVGWNGTSQGRNDTGTIPGNARRPSTFQEFA